MRLLVATDHRFVSDGSGVSDTYCFDRGFFDDYRVAFPDVQVAARIAEVDQLPPGARRSDGDGVHFAPLPDERGFRWLLGPPAVRSLVERAVADADAVCVRLPSVAGSCAAGAARRQGKPVMFELIGDPMASFSTSGAGAIGPVLGRWEARRARRAIATAVAGSYVSQGHLQARYPPPSGALVESISSIRLPTQSIGPPREFTTQPRPLAAVLTASLVPVKRHDVLLRAVASACAHGADVTVTLMGDGPQGMPLRRLAEELDITSRVTFLGHVSDRTELERVLDASDLFVMTSATEGMPRAMLEAMARGLPAVGTAVGGIAELLPDGQLVPSGDHAALGRLLAALQRDPARLSTCARHSHAVAQQYEASRLSDRRQRLLSVLQERSAT